MGTCLDHVYDNMSRQIDHFSSSVDVYNAKMKDTVEQALELYQKRIDAELEVRSKILKSKREECAARLEMIVQEAEVECATDKMRDEREHEKELKKMKRAAEKDKQELEKQQRLQEQVQKKAEQKLERQKRKDEAELQKQAKRDEQDRKRAENQIENMKKKDSALHEKVLKELEAQSKKLNIDQQERNILMNELQIETDRYNKEFALATEAMKNALQTDKSCWIKHHAPKIEWGPPAQVVPGSVEWRSGG